MRVFVRQAHEQRHSQRFTDEACNDENDDLPWVFVHGKNSVLQYTLDGLA